MFQYQMWSSLYYISLNLTIFNEKTGHGTSLSVKKIFYEQTCEVTSVAKQQKKKQRNDFLKILILPLKNVDLED